MQALLAKTGNMFCSRLHLVVASELMDLVNSTALAPFGKRWKSHQKFIHVTFSLSSIRKYDRVLEDVAFQFNEALSRTSEDFVNHSQLTVGHIIMNTTYGISVDSPNDQYIFKAKEAMTMVSCATVLGAFLVDLVPSFKYLPTWTPFTSFHHIGHHGRSLVAKLVETLFQYVKCEIAQNVFEHNVKWVCASMYAAGQEVISSSILNMIMAMAKYSEKMKIAQAELDEVLSTDCHPTIADRKNLLYVHAIIKETLCWHPPLPMDIAQCSLEDMQYNKYFISKGTIVIPNIWNIAHQADEVFPPDMFASEQFLQPNPTQDPSEYCFGFRCRVCPGKYLAENSVFLITALVLSAFDISPAVAPDGTKIPISVQYSSGLVR
ncbi:cytochrome p450 [Moniliophthora roreri MCA 2997]|uniref:Cytochrome p450 n=1 Tax=Moniliophthora roreri (strain MCA 2997) TaxID=1381753 RepID=V2XHK4_MONRO|nr:cytochrome p450 [Moniliophthora roreri MCA 2997]